MSAKKTIIFLLLCSIFFGSKIAHASHIYAGDLLYTHVSGTTYRLALTLYGDCSAPLSSTLDSVTPMIFIYNNTTKFRNITLKLEAPGIEVSPVCPKMLNQTICRGLGGTLPGVKKFVYIDTVDLQTLSAGWQFIFSGNLGSIGWAGRSQNITNIVYNGGYTYVAARLNNLNGPNSSPGYTTVPTPFYCTNLNQQYNQGAIDPDGDSLVFSLVPGIDGTGYSTLLSNPVTYYPTFTAQTPLTTEPGSFAFSTVNGQLSFKPVGMQNSLVVIQVSEYRNGVLVGTSEREMTFIVTDNCEGTPPSLTVRNVTGGAVTGSNLVNICVGTPHLTFDISVANPDGDTTEVSSSSVPATASLHISNNFTPTPAIHFEWDTDTLRAGAYTFFLQVKNNHCPLANRQTIAYTINVTPYPVVAGTPVSPTNCVHQALVTYDLSLGYLPRTLVVADTTGRAIHTYTDTTGSITDSLPAGNYTLTVSSHPQCKTQRVLSVTEGGTLPLPAVTAHYCVGDTALPLQAHTYGPEAVITWFDADYNVLPHAPTPSTATAARLLWYVQEQYKVCTSLKTPATVNVHPLPLTAIAPPPPVICLGDTVLLEATGAATYVWHPTDRVQFTADSTPFTRLIAPGQFKVIATTEFGCVDSASVSYDRIEQCCQYSYPNAFTPNGDGRNDGFKIITYGNSWSYRLAIYNRWGQMVFLSFDPGKYWDGTQYGNLCEIGSYYYHFTGRCLTGYTEEHKGEVTLIR